MSDFIIAILIVTILRGFMVLAGTTFAYMGYQLFIKGIYDVTSDLNAAWADKKLVLTKAGPGIFFALFGVVVVATSVWRDTGLMSSTNAVALQSQSHSQVKTDPAPKVLDALKYINVAKIIETSKADFDEEWGSAERAILFNTYVRSQNVGISPDVYNDFVSAVYIPVLKQKPGKPRAQNLELARRSFFSGFDPPGPAQAEPTPAPQTPPAEVKFGLGI